jgi:hypothetical protein
LTLASIRGALTEIAVIPFEMNVEGASPAGATLSMAGPWMHLVCIQNRVFRLTAKVGRKPSLGVGPDDAGDEDLVADLTQC